MHPAAIAARTPVKPAVIMAASGAVLSYRQLDEGSNRFAQLLRAQGLRPGDGIALFLENHPRFFELVWAAQRAGLYYTAISSRLTAPELAYIVGDCGAKVIVSSRAMADVASALTNELPGVERRLMLDAEIAGWERFEDAVAAFPATPIPDEQEGNDMLSSGDGTTEGLVLRSRRPLGTPPGLQLLVGGLYGANATPSTSRLPLYPRPRCASTSQCSASAAPAS